MNRRSIFKLFAGAVMASAMEVCGWEGLPKKPFWRVKYAAAWKPDLMAFNSLYTKPGQIEILRKNLEESVSDVWVDKIFPRAT